MLPCGLFYESLRMKNSKRIRGRAFVFASDPCFFLQNLDLLSVHEQNWIRTMQNSVLPNSKLNICRTYVGKTK